MIVRKVKRYLILLVAALATVGCIKNDIPYPVIVGMVQKMEIEGQVELKIDGVNSVINVVLNDTVDLRKVRILMMERTEESSSTLDSGSVIDLTGGGEYKIGPAYLFTISTFQDYQWQIVATQPIVRDITMSGSIGKSLIDEQNRTVVTKVALSQDLYDITVEQFRLGPSNAVYTPDPYTICDFSEPVTVEMRYLDIVENWTIEVQHSFENVITGKANAWAKFALVDGDILPASTLTPAFEYKEATASKWLEAAATNKSGKITAALIDLKPNTEYLYKARLGGEYGAEVAFRTETAPVVANLNFDEAYLGGSGGKVWYFNANPPGGNSFWATGNDGVMVSPGRSNTTSVTGNEAVSGSAVRMETFTGVLMVKVAAGNLFLGNYATDMGDPIKSAKFGRPYKGRPTRMSGWYRYQPKPVDFYWDRYASFPDSIGKADWGQVYVVLERWPVGAEVRPAEDQIVRIAYGEFRTNKEVSTYSKFDFPITYYSLTDRPTHMIICCTSSINGGLFCGGTGSVMYIDDFDLSFDYQQP